MWIHLLLVDEKALVEAKLIRGARSSVHSVDINTHDPSLRVHFHKLPLAQPDQQLKTTPANISHVGRSSQPASCRSPISRQACVRSPCNDRTSRHSSFSTETACTSTSGKQSSRSAGASRTSYGQNSSGSTDHQKHDSGSSVGKRIGCVSPQFSRSVRIDNYCKSSMLSSDDRFRNKSHRNTSSLRHFCGDDNFGNKSRQNTASANQIKVSRNCFQCVVPCCWQSIFYFPSGLSSISWANGYTPYPHKKVLLCSWQ